MLERDAFGRLCLLLALLLAWPAFAAAATGDEAPFTEVRLQDLLKNNPQTGRPVDSIAELVPLLPQELRRNFLFAYESRSPFKTSITPALPRVILFTDDARLVLTFIGDDRAPGAELLETMAFDDSAKTFVLHAYLLPAGERRSWRPSAQDARCERCHGDDPRPIFDSYPLWPGFYGSVQDTFPDDRMGRKERADYAAFMAGAARTGVYRHLLYPQGSPVSPFLDPSLFKDDTVELDPDLLAYLPNARFGIALTDLNRQRIYRKLAAGPDFAANEKKMLALLLECRSNDRPDRGTMRAVEAQLTTENIERLKRLGELPADVHKERNDMKELAMIRELAEIDAAARLAGIDRADWSMALAPGSLAFFDGVLSGISNGKSFYLKEDLILEILSHLSEREAAFRKSFRWQNAFDDYGYPFGRRADLALAQKSCARLGGSSARAHPAT